MREKREREMRERGKRDNELEETWERGKIVNRENEREKRERERGG